MTKTRERELRRQLRELRAQWRAWHTTKGLYSLIGCHEGHPDLYVCDHRQPEPGCEGCAAHEHRNERCHAIEQQAAEIKAELAG